MAFSIGQSVLKIDSTEGGTATTDISQYVTNVTFNAERDVAEIKRIGGNAVAQIVGNVVSTYEVEGAFDPTLHGYFTSAMAAATPVTRTVEVGFGGTTTALPKETAEVYIVNYEVEGDGEDPTSWSAEMAVSGSVAYGTW